MEDCNEREREEATEPDKPEENPAIVLDSLKQISCQIGSDQNPEDHPRSIHSDMNSSPLRSGGKVKRKSRSTRRRLNAMASNTSLHFSDTDSEGELTTMNQQSRSSTSPTSLPTEPRQKPIISVTLDDTKTDVVRNDALNCLSPDGIPRSSSFVDNLTDVDELYGSEPENEQKVERSKSLTIENNPLYQGETDCEEMEGDEDVQPPIYVEPRSDIFCELSGETITTKEGDGPFSVEVRNKMHEEESKKPDVANDVPDIAVVCETDEEDMAVSDEENLEEASCSHREVIGDIEIPAASQIVMKNVSKMEHMLAVKETSDEAISDCHTDTEDFE